MASPQYPQYIRRRDPRGVHFEDATWGGPPQRVDSYGRRISNTLEEGGISSQRHVPVSESAAQFYAMSAANDEDEDEDSYDEEDEAREEQRRQSWFEKYAIKDEDEEENVKPMSFIQRLWAHFHAFHRERAYRETLPFLAADRAIFTPDEFINLRDMANRQGTTRRRKVIRKHICDELVRNQFIVLLAKAMWSAGAPHHSIQGILYMASEALEIEAEFLVSGSVIFVMLGTPYDATARTHAVRGAGPAHLQNISEIEYIYHAVVNDELSADDANERLGRIIHETPQASVVFRAICAFMCSLAIGPIAFGASFVDMWVGAGCSAILVLCQDIFARRSIVLNSIYEVVAAFCVSLLARGLSMIPGQLFCYEAVSSSGIVMILPGYAMLTALMEIFEESKVPGVVRLIATLVYTIFFSAGLSMGSAFFFTAYPHARHGKDGVQALAAGLVSVASTLGNFTVAAPNESFAGFTKGTFLYTNDTLIHETAQNFIDGCYRDQSWEWYKQPLPLWTLIALVPTFALFISMFNHLHFLSTMMIATVACSCISFASNKAATTYVSGAPPGFVGALVVGFLGHIFERIWKKSAFPVMATAVLFIVPSGLSNAGGLANTGDYFSDILAVGLRMIEVVISIVFGLSIPNLIFTWAGGKYRPPGFEL